MKQIALTRGQITMVDDEDFEWLSRTKWNAAWCHRTRSFYAQRNAPGEDKRQRTLIMHREIMGALKGQEVDHINRNTLDNRRENLRVCSKAENLLNRGTQRNNTSGFKGVKRHTQCNKWVASVQRDRVRKYLGLFATPIEAAIAYDKEVVCIHGEFAVTNASLGLL